MNDNYLINRLVTKQYLQACERACGPLQGSGNAGGGTFPTLEDLDLSKYNGPINNTQEDTLYDGKRDYFVSSDGSYMYYTTYGSNLDDGNYKTWYIDLKDPKAKPIKVFDYKEEGNERGAYISYFFETSKGIVYGAAPEQSDFYGFLKFNKDKPATHIMVENSDIWNSVNAFFEDSEGEIYFTSADYRGCQGICKIYDDVKAVQISTEGTDLYYFIEDSEHNIYVGGEGLYKISNKTKVEKISSSVSKIYTIDKNNQIVGWSDRSSIFVYNLTTKTYKTLTASTTDLDHFYKSLNNNVYILGTTSGCYKIIENDIKVLNSTSGLLWDVIFFAKNNNVYFGSSKSTNEALYILDEDNAEATLTADTYTGIMSFVEDQNKKVYCIIDNNNINEFSEVGSSTSIIFGGNLAALNLKSGGLYVRQIANMSSTIYFIIDGVGSKVAQGLSEDYKYLFENNEMMCVSTTEVPATGTKIVEINNTDNTLKFITL